MTKKALRHSCTSWLMHQWYQPSPGWLWLFFPLMLLYLSYMRLRRFLYKVGWLKPYKAPIPVWVIGNLTVGGNGKTPFVMLLAQKATSLGLKVGLVSRGYGAQGLEKHRAYRVPLDANADHYGDEPSMLASSLGVPVYIALKRPLAVQALLKDHPECDLVIADDGFQHIQLYRDRNILLEHVDRVLGNGYCLPMGPCREQVSVVSSNDKVVAYGYTPPHELGFYLRLKALINLADPKERRTRTQGRERAHVVTGIASPERFLASVIAMGFEVREHLFPDHHIFSADDLSFDDDDIIIMTEKDAIKVRSLVSQKMMKRCWCACTETVTTPALDHEMQLWFNALRVTDDLGPKHADSKQNRSALAELQDI